MVMVTENDRETARAKLAHRTDLNGSHDMVVEIVAEMLAEERSRPKPDAAAAPRGTVHDLKCWPKYFGDILAGKLTFCMRKNDRGYRVGDVLHLMEYEPGEKTTRPFEPPNFGKYTGREVRRRVTYIMAGGEHGIATDYVVLSLEPEEKEDTSVPSKPAAADQLHELAMLACREASEVFVAANGHFDAGAGIAAVLRSLADRVKKAAAPRRGGDARDKAIALAREQLREITRGKFVPEEALARRAELGVDRGIEVTCAAMERFGVMAVANVGVLSRALYQEFAGAPASTLGGLRAEVQRRWADTATRVGENYRRLLAEEHREPASSPSSEHRG